MRKDPRTCAQFLVIASEHGGNPDTLALITLKQNHTLAVVDYTLG